MKKKKEILVEIIRGDYCECGCKGECNTDKLKITINKKSYKLNMSDDIEEFLNKVKSEKFKIIC